MTVANAFEIALAIIVSIGGASLVIIGLSGWLGKIWANRLMQADIAKHNKDLEEHKATLARIESEHGIRFSKLHARQAEVISQIYANLYELQFALNLIKFELAGREIREDNDRKYFRATREEWEMREGIDTLAPEEKERIDSLQKSLREMQHFYGTNRLYLPLQCCNAMDRLSIGASFIASNYHNVAIKDKDGNLLVNPQVKRVWDAAHEEIPKLLEQLDKEFRTAIGMSQ